jgi:hypothetical protein
MKRTAINFWLDIVSFVVMVGLALTGGITHYVLPSGTGNWLTFLGLGRRDFGQIHFYLGFAVVFLLAVHLAMHWSWLCGFVAKRLGKEQPSRRARIWAGLGTVAFFGVVLVGGLVWAAARVENRFAEQERRRGPSWLETPSEAPVSPARPATEQPSPRRVGLADHEDEADCPAAAAINGRVTLQEAADAAGLTVTSFLRALGVPYPVDARERLGGLRRQFGFSMQDVRRLVCTRR